MNLQPKDDLDRVIDDVLDSMVNCEPRGVSGTSIRRALGESRRARLPLWLAAAAVLILGLGVALQGRAPVVEAPRSVAGSIVSHPPISGVTPSPQPAYVAYAAVTSRPTGHRSAVVAMENPPYEGLPRLAIASIELPEPLMTPRLDSDPIQVSLIDIAPLSLSTLNPEQEHK